LLVKLNQRAIEENEINIRLDNGKGAITLPNDASGSIILDVAGNWGQVVFGEAAV
jgi:hypothetical protein